MNNYENFSYHNILVLSAGRRVELVDLFKKAMLNLNIDGKIIAADLQTNAPALFFADDKEILPRINSDNYIESLISIAKKHNIRWIIPTIDTELQTLSKFKEKIYEESGAIVMISDQSVIDICRDKINTSEFFKLNNIGAPYEYKKSEIGKTFDKFPIFIKPKSGSSSKDIYKINNFEEFINTINRVEDPIIQEFIDGDEFSVDVFVDMEHNPITIVPRLRVHTRGGEISKGRIIKDKLIIEDVKELISILKPKGHITIQLFKKENTIKYIEINPRFGGGAPMSILSGANSCENLLKLSLGEKLIYNENYQSDITFLRFDRSICIDDNMEIINDKSSDF